MGINGIDSAMSPVSAGIPGGSGANPQIKSLEQKLLQLNTEKRKAVQEKDEEKVKKLEKQIQEIEQKIQKLKEQEAQKQKETEQDKSAAPKETDRISPLQASTGWYA